MRFRDTIQSVEPRGLDAVEVLRAVDAMLEVGVVPRNTGPFSSKLLERWQTGLEPATAGTTIRLAFGGASSESPMASGFAPRSVCPRRTSICGDIRRLSGCTGRNADFCQIGHTPGSSQQCGKNSRSLALILAVLTS